MQSPSSKLRLTVKDILVAAAGIMIGLSIFFYNRLIVLQLLGIMAELLYFYIIVTTYIRRYQFDSIQEKKIERIEEKAEKEPEKIKFAWDLARVKLEAYFDRNLSQVRMIFFVAVFVMMVGFGFILWGLNHAISKPESIKTSYLATISGIITEFIGVTFMVIYRSTMTQANQFMEILERINTVGMAVQILDAIPEQSTDLKNSTRADLVSLLLSVNAKFKGSRLGQRNKIGKTSSAD